MDGLKGLAVASGGGGGGRVGIGHHDDDINDGMQCSDHPYRPNPGGICAFCLQEKLGKLVSSSFPLPLRASTSSSSPPSFRSDNNTVGIAATSSSASVSLQDTKTINSCPTSSRNPNECYTRKAPRNLFHLSKKKKSNAGSSSDNMVFKRSKSTTCSGSRRSNNHSDRRSDHHDSSVISPRKRNGFWSFLYLSSSSTAPTPKKNGGKIIQSCGNNVNGVLRSKEKNLMIAEDDDDDNIDGYIRKGVLSTVAASNSSNFERKVSRSRSVGCGSRSFSGDFFERISTGFGDCTLRRVESHREGKPKAVNNGGGPMKERVKCGGIFGGFNIIASSSSSSSSSSYWVSSTTDQDHVNVSNKSSLYPSSSLVHGRNNKSWGWANFASPMRAFGNNKHSSKDGKREGNGASSNNKTPDLSSIPSLLAVRS